MAWGEEEEEKEEEEEEREGEREGGLSTCSSPLLCVCHTPVFIIVRGRE
jgi:hypothetical protein